MHERFFRGWYQIAFERELTEKLTPVAVGRLPLVLVRRQDGFEAYDAICPHRGAHLAYGGELEGDAIRCPFHGHLIGLGEACGGELKVRGYRTLSVGGLVFVLFSERHENGFSHLMAQLDETHFVVQGFTLKAKTPAEMVVENGFDRAHFRNVHGLKSDPDLHLLPSDNGELIVQGTFQASAFNSVWHNDAPDRTSTEIGFLARMFSPNLCISRLGGGPDHHLVISGATPNGDGSCTIRVSVAVPVGSDDRAPSQPAIRALLRDSKLAYEQDIVIWEHRAPDAPSQFQADDDLVIEFHRFCKGFLEVRLDAENVTRPLR
jgi:3-ketosteroid 9alpha-monooxygenase subunit A